MDTTNNKYDYNYYLSPTSKQKRWVFVRTDNSIDLYEPDAFFNLVDSIRDGIHGEVKVIGDGRVKITGDELDLVYQWDDLFGIVIERPYKVSVQEICDFFMRFVKCSIRD
ncbi:MAG: hypothetical protein GX852_06055 [Clostridiales bacterium]|nr:hypothetical protein [Clostridiales bacterium]